MRNLRRGGLRIWQVMALIAGAAGLFALVRSAFGLASLAMAFGVIFAILVLPKLTLEMISADRRVTSRLRTGGRGRRFLVLPWKVFFWVGYFYVAAAFVVMVLVSMIPMMLVLGQEP